MRWESAAIRVPNGCKPTNHRLVMDVLNKGGIVPDALQMIDSTVIRAHHQATGAKGGFRDRVSAA